MGRFRWFGVTDALALFRRRSKAARGDAREVCAHIQEHLSALAELFALEISQYLKIQTIRTLLCLAAALVLCTAYLGFWAFTAAMLAPLTGWAGAIGLSCAANIIVAILLLLIAAKLKPGAVAPDTVKEVKNDWQCLQLLLRQDSEKPKS